MIQRWFEEFQLSINQQPIVEKVDLDEIPVQNISEKNKLMESNISESLFDNIKMDFEPIRKVFSLINN